MMLLTGFVDHMSQTVCARQTEVLCMQTLLMWGSIQTTLACLAVSVIAPLPLQQSGVRSHPPLQ
jgi:hypothetical protein